MNHKDLDVWKTAMLLAKKASNFDVVSVECGYFIK